MLSQTCGQYCCVNKIST